MDRFGKGGDTLQPVQLASLNSEAKLSGLSSQRAALPSIPSDPLSHVEQQLEARHQMESQVKRISEMYNEEKQKLDLMMKIKQTQQKQALQRKLLDRRQNNSGNAANAKEGAGGFAINAGRSGGLRGGAGFSSSDAPDHASPMKFPEAK